jgi:hypothetical protein
MRRISIRIAGKSCRIESSVMDGGWRITATWSGLYLEYVQNLNRILDKKFGKTGQVDTFTYNYVADTIWQGQ